MKRFVNIRKILGLRKLTIIKYRFSLIITSLSLLTKGNYFLGESLFSKNDPYSHLFVSELTYRLTHDSSISFVPDKEKTNIEKNIRILFDCSKQVNAYPNISARYHWRKISGKRSSFINLSFSYLIAKIIKNRTGFPVLFLLILC